MLFGIAVKFDGKVEKLSSKDKTPLLSMRPKPYKMMFFSLSCLLLFWGSLAVFLESLALPLYYERFLLLIPKGFYWFFSTIFGLFVLITWFFLYFKIGNVNFYDDEIEIIPFLGKKKIYKYSKLSVIFSWGPTRVWARSGGPAIIIININKTSFTKLERLLLLFSSKVSGLSGLLHKNPDADFLIAEEILTGKVQNIYYNDKYQWQEWKLDTLREINNERK